MSKNNDVLAIGTRGFSERNFIVSTNVLYTHYPIHNHDCVELEYVLKGCGTTIINGKKHSFSDGTLCLCTNTDFHELFPGCECSFLNINIKTECIAPEILISLSDAVLIQNYDRTLIDKINYEYKYLNTKSDMYFKNLINRILIDCVHKIKPDMKDEQYAKLSAPVGKAIQIIHRRFSENISLDGIAEAVELSPNYFSTKFHNEVKVSFQSYLLNIRLEAARKYLIATDYSVTDLCFFVGFNNYVNFSKAFKKRYGVTPTKYRSEK